MRLEELVPVFGGHIRELGDRRWLDTHVGGLRAFVICRAAIAGGVTFDLAVFTKDTRELDPFFARDESTDWKLEGDPQDLPRLKDGFVFAGCRCGILVASNTSEPSLETLVSTLWQLAEWARKRWIPDVAWSNELNVFQAREQARMRRAHRTRKIWMVVSLALVVIAVVLWPRVGAGSALLAILAALAAYPHEPEYEGGAY